jgi:hypothetical protein
MLWPDLLTRVAHLVGIGRGVDVVIYLVLIWLFREAVLSRVRYHRERKEMTELVRQLAMRSSVEVAGGEERRGPGASV